MSPTIIAPTPANPLNIVEPKVTASLVSQIKNNGNKIIATEAIMKIDIVVIILRLVIVVSKVCIYRI